MKIGLGISCHNRNEISELVIKKWKDICPDEIKMVIVDDGSIRPIKGATFRFEQSQGIAKVKNKCIELLDDCDYIFLSDDDIYPIDALWYKKYIDAHIATKCHYMSCTWDKLANGTKNGHKQLRKTKNLVEYSHPSGVLLFMTKKCIQRIGGMDTDFGKYANEHVEHARRAYNCRLTPFPYCDIPSSIHMFYSYDYNKKIESSVEDRKYWLVKNKELLKKTKFSNKFKPYK